MSTSSPSPVVSSPTPVVLVHGLRVSGGTLHRIAESLPGRPVGHPDLPGHGLRMDETYTLDAAIDTLAAEINRLGSPAVLAGMSMGGYVAMATAARYPHLVAGLIPMCCTAQPSPLLAAPFEAFGAVTSILPKEAAAISRALTRVVVGRQVSADMEVNGLALRSIQTVVGELKRFDALDAIARYPGPIRFINGGWDQFRVHEKRFLAASAQGEVVVLPRAMHLFPLIQPTVVANLIDNFASGLTGTR